jgi:hypothetical protein
MFEVLSARLIFFILFSARFSFNVLPCFFVLDFCGDLSDMATLRQANVETTPPGRVPSGWPRPSPGFNRRQRPDL